MTIRNLDALFQPKVIALVGASNQSNSGGAVLAKNLIGAGFAGPVPINPHESSIGSTLGLVRITPTELLRYGLRGPLGL